MKRLLFIGITFVALLISSSGFSQGVKDVRINEILVINQDNYEDDYGHREGWIELFNAGFSQVDIGGCYLTIYKDGKGEPYRIPKGDPRTIMAPQSYLIFIAEGTATKGTFHTSFTLDKTGYLALFDQSGRGTPVSEVTYDVAKQIPDVSIGWMKDSNGKLVFGTLSATTPNATNDVVEAVPADEKFRMLDPYGVVMALTAMSVVFTALALLYLVFRTIGKTMVRMSKPKDKNEKKTKTSAPSTDEITGEEIAAIVMALRQYEDNLHDVESNVVTINKVARAYSPWNAKIYGIRQLPDKNRK